MTYPKKARIRGRVTDLTPREMDVLRLVAGGYSTRQIASGLGIALKTVSCHRIRIMDKLDLHDVAGLTRYAIRKGLVDTYGKPDTVQSVQALASQVEAAHAEYVHAMEAYRVALVERGDLEVNNPDGRTSVARYHQAEMAAHRKYHSALLALKDFLVIDSSRSRD